MIYPLPRRKLFVNKANVGEINVSCEQYKAAIDAVISSNGVDFVPNDEILKGD